MAKLFLTVTIVHTFSMISLYGDLKREMEGKPPGKTAVTYVIMNGIEKPRAKRTNKKGEKTVP